MTGDCPSRGSKRHWLVKSLFLTIALAVVAVVAIDRAVTVYHDRRGAAYSKFLAAALAEARDEQEVVRILGIPDMRCDSDEAAVFLKGFSEDPQHVALIRQSKTALIYWRGDMLGLVLLDAGGKKIAEFVVRN